MLATNVMAGSFDWSGASPAAVFDEAVYWAEQGDESDPDYMDPAEAQWSYVATFPIARALAASHRSIDAAKAFFESELHRQGLDSERLAGFHSMLADGPRDPIVFIDRGDATFVWDGWHRIAAAVVRGDPTIPAIVGVKRR